MRRILTISAAFPLIWSLGCGEDWTAETYPASGRVTIDGQPPEGAIVQLQPVGEAADERNSRPWGLVEDDGTYDLGTYEVGDGAPAGQYVATITWPVDPSVPSPSDRLGGRFSRPDQSPWRFTIGEGDNELPPIELSGVTVDMDATAPQMGGPPMPGVNP